MALRNSGTLKLSLSALAMATMLQGAYAQDASLVAARLKSIIGAQGTELNWASISGSGSSIVLEGTTVKIAGQPDVFTIGNVALDGIAEAGGGYTIGKVSLPDYNLSEAGMTFSMTGTALTNVKLSAEGSTDPLASMLFYDTADVHFEMTPPASDKAMVFSGGAQKFTADLSGVSDPSSKQIIEALGYQNIAGDMKIAGSWNPVDGKMAFTQFDIKVDNAGTLGTTFDISGYTPAFIKSLQDLRKQMAAAPAGADNSAQGMAMLGLMQQLNFNSAAIKFTDDSLTNKILEFVAKSQGASPADIANMAKGAVPFALAQLNNPELTQQAAAAVTAFLDNPKSLTIAAKPAAPVPFAVLAAGGMGDPMSLPKTLGVTVTAND
jgi:hypothetical protein